MQLTPIQQQSVQVTKSVVDVVSSAMVADEEVALGGRVTVKLQSKLKFEKVSPALWILANSGIIRVLMKRPVFI